MPSTKPRVQVTVDPELGLAIAELRGERSRSQTVRDLAIRGAEAIRGERSGYEEAIDHLRRIATGEDDGYDFSVSERLHAER